MAVSFKPNERTVHQQVAGILGSEVQRSYFGAVTILIKTRPQPVEMLREHHLGQETYPPTKLCQVLLTPGGKLQVMPGQSEQGNRGSPRRAGYVAQTSMNKKIKPLMSSARINFNRCAYTNFRSLNNTFSLRCFSLLDCRPALLGKPTAPHGANYPHYQFLILGDRCLRLLLFEKCATLKYVHRTTLSSTWN